MLFARLVRLPSSILSSTNFDVVDVVNVVVVVDVVDVVDVDVKDQLRPRRRRSCQVVVRRHRVVYVVMRRLSTCRQSCPYFRLFKKNNLASASSSPSYRDFVFWKFGRPPSLKSENSDKQRSVHQDQDVGQYSRKSSVTFTKVVVVSSGVIYDSSVTKIKMSDSIVVTEIWTNPVSSALPQRNLDNPETHESL